MSVDVAVTAHVRRPDTLPDPNEIGRRIARLWPHGTADERALRDSLEVATLLRMLVDEHGYKGDRYVLFAEKRGISKSDAYILYRLGNTPIASSKNMLPAMSGRIGARSRDSLA